MVHPSFLAMRPLNSKLQLALLKRKRSGNILEKGFTLVELMIVIVIVGILSAVALPNFLNQSEKAKATEAQTAISAAFKNAQALYIEEGATGMTNTCATYDLANLASKWNFTCTWTAASNSLAISAAGQGANTGLTVVGSVDVVTGVVTKPAIS